MQIVQKKVLELIPYINNARTHSEEQVAQIAASIKEFGFTNPILTDGDNGVIAGHGRLLAARKLGMTELPTIELSHLSPAQKKAYIIADNKLALNSGWDDELLALEICDLENNHFNLEILAFSDDELDKIKKSVDLTEELKEKLIELYPIKYTRILISIRTDNAEQISGPIKNIINSGAEIDYGGN